MYESDVPVMLLDTVIDGPAALSHVDLSALTGDTVYPLNSHWMHMKKSVRSTKRLLKFVPQFHLKHPVPTTFTKIPLKCVLSQKEIEIQKVQPTRHRYVLFLNVGLRAGIHAERER
jgi:hypothetical protein